MKKQSWRRRRRILWSIFKKKRKKENLQFVIKISSKFCVRSWIVRVRFLLNDCKIVSPLCRWGYSCWPYTLQSSKTFFCLEFDSKLQPMVRIKFWKNRDCGVPLHYYFTQVNSAVDCLSGSNLHLGFDPKYNESGSCLKTASNAKIIEVKQQGACPVLIRLTS